MKTLITKHFAKYKADFQQLPKSKRSLGTRMSICYWM